MLLVKFSNLRKHNKSIFFSENKKSLKNIDTTIYLHYTSVEHHLIVKQ